MAPVPLGLVTLAILSAWAVVPWAWGLPALWVGAMVLTFALAPRDRSFFRLSVALIGLALLGVSWSAALDRELFVALALNWVLGVVVFGLARVARLSDRQILVLALAVAATAVVGIAQVVGFLRPSADLLAEIPSGFRDAASVRMGSSRAMGAARLPGHFAFQLLMVSPLLVAGARREAGWLRGVASVGLGLCVVGIGLSRSLAAFLVGGVMVSVSIARISLPRRKVVLSLLGFLVAASMVLASRQDLNTLEPIRLRLINWTTTWSVFLQQPWIGVGLGGVGQGGLSTSSGAINITPYTHNSYLQVLAEFGLAGTAYLVSFLWWLVRRIRAGWQDQFPLTLAVLAVPLHNLVDFSFYSAEVLLPWCVLLGSLVSRTGSLPPRPLSSRLLVPVLLSGCLISTLTWRSEQETIRAVAAPSKEAIAHSLAAARWAPWRVTPLLIGVDRIYEVGADDQDLPLLEEALRNRSRIRPRSSAWAEGRARLLLLQGRCAEALPWVREAGRRAPWRRDLAVLEAECSPDG